MPKRIRLSSEDVASIMRMIDDRVRYADIAKRFGIGFSRISRIVKYAVSKRMGLPDSDREGFAPDGLTPKKRL